MNRKETGRSRAWARTLLSMLLSGTMLAGPGTMRVDAAKEGDVRESWQERGVDTVLSPDVTSTYDSRTGVTTQSKKKTSTQQSVTYTQKYQLVDYKDTLKDSTVDVYTASTTGIPKKGDAYDGGTVTSVTTSHDDKSHKTIVTVTYQKTEDVYIGGAIPKKGNVSYKSDNVPKMYTPWKGGKVTGITLDQTKKTFVNVQYDTTQDVYTAGDLSGIPKKGDVTYGSNTAGIPKKGDAFNGGKVTDVAVGYNQDVHRTDVLVTYETTQEVLTPSSTGIPKPGETYNGGTVYTVTTSQDGYKTNATILTTKTEDVYTASTTGIPKQGDSYNGGTVTSVTTTHDDAKHETKATIKYEVTGDVYTARTKTEDVYTASTTGIPKKGDSYNGGTVTDVTTTHDDANHKTAATIKYDTTSDVYTADTTGIPKQGDSYDGGTVTSVTTTHDDVKHETAATIKYDTTSDVYTADTTGIPKQGDSYNGGKVTSVTTTHDDAKHETVATVKYDTTSTTRKRVKVGRSKYFGGVSYVWRNVTTTVSNTATVTVADNKSAKTVSNTATVTVADNKSAKTVSNTATMTVADTKTTIAIPKTGDAYNGGTVTDVITTHDDVKHETVATVKYNTTSTSRVYVLVGRRRYGYNIYGWRNVTTTVSNTATVTVADSKTTGTASKTSTTTVADVKSTKTTSSSATLTVDPTKSTKTVTNTAWLLLDDLKTTVSDVTTTHDDAKHETKATVTYEATQPPVYTAGDLTGIPKEGDAYGGGTVRKVLTTHDDVKHQTNATVWWKKTVAYAVDTNLIPLKGDPYDVVVTDVKNKYDAATKKTQVDVTYSVQATNGAYSYSNSFLKTFYKEDESAAGYKLPAVGDTYSGKLANGFNTHNDTTHQTYINPVFSVLLPGTRAITSRVYAYVADYNTEGGVNTYAVADLKSAKTATETKTLAVADTKSTQTASETKTFEVPIIKSTVQDVATTHDAVKHETTATVTYDVPQDVYTPDTAKIHKKGDAFTGKVIGVATAYDFRLKKNMTTLTYNVSIPGRSFSRSVKFPPSSNLPKSGATCSGQLSDVALTNLAAKHQTQVTVYFTAIFNNSDHSTQCQGSGMYIVDDIKSTSKTVTVIKPDTKSSSTTSYTNVFEVKDTKKTENVTTTIKEPVYGWVTTATKSHQVVTTSYVPVGTIVQPSLLPSTVTATPQSVFLGSAQTRRAVKADRAIASTAQANTGSAVAYNRVISTHQRKLETAQAALVAYNAIRDLGDKKAIDDAWHKLKEARKAAGLPKLSRPNDDERDNESEDDDKDDEKGHHDSPGSNGNSNSGSWSGSKGNSNRNN